MLHKLKTTSCYSDKQNTVTIPDTLRNIPRSAMQMLMSDF